MTATLDRPAADMAAPATVIRDVRDALDRLDQLGGPDQIAAHLAAAGIVGDPGCPYTCAIAQYLVRAVPAICAVTITVTAGVMFSIRSRRGTYSAPDLPCPVVEFIQHYDRAAYPALIYRAEPHAQA